MLLTLRRLTLATLAATALAFGGCGSDDEEGPSDEQQVRTVGKAAADAFASKDGGKFCEVTDTSKLEEQVKDSDRKDLVKVLDEDGPQAVCEQLADEVLFKDLSAEEKASGSSSRAPRSSRPGSP